jgi:hypothetical protein
MFDRIRLATVCALIYAVAHGDEVRLRRDFHDYRAL